LIDRLKQHVRHQYSLPAFVTIGPTPLFCRPVEFESRLSNDVQRYFHQIALWRFQSDFPVVESLETSAKHLLLIQWDTGLDSGQLTIEASIVTFLDQFPIQTGRGNFQCVRKRNQIFNIE